MIKHVLIVGLGLIGGSLAKAIKKNIGIKITAIDINKDYIDKALDAKIIDKGMNKLESKIDADIVFICLPVGSIIKCISYIIPFLNSGCIITDVGSTKKKIVDEVKKIMPPNLYFIGGHPMTGSEKYGFDASQPGLFNNNYYFLVPLNKTPKYIIKKFVHYIINKINAKPVIITGEEHDKVVGIISHLPHILSTTLTNFVYQENVEFLKYAAGGFKDTTRIAMSKTDIWEDIVFSNKEVIKELLKEYVTTLNDFISFIDNKDINSMEKFFDTAREVRSKIL